ncbi:MULTISPECIES: NIPSNAP family protein [Pseudomonas]|uniref:NIPSNAP family protein n=1 Tax=Pseudomonas TaxID=286 RepID=UPI0009B833F6|nr:MULTISPECIES: NIPSNAP family protein [Pseudomonas]MCK2122712.1 NIPSNAP family protein [Pseudomonas sp. PNPG3]QUN65174.1 NIPSNAP family protein [Pseudomonas sp. JS425]
MIELRPFSKLGGKDHGWLDTRHHFSFAEYQSEALGNLIGYFQPQTGDLNRVIHLWGFESLEDRNSRRAALSANPKWREFLGKAGGFVTAQHAEILSGASFSPIR